MIFKIIFLIIFSSATVFACGCVDASTASSGANNIKSNYDTLDEQLSDKFFTLKTDINNTINSEIMDKNLLEDNLILEKASLLELYQNNFLLNIERLMK